MENEQSSTIIYNGNKTVICDDLDEEVINIVADIKEKLDKKENVNEYLLKVNKRSLVIAANFCVALGEHTKNVKEILEEIIKAIVHHVKESDIYAHQLAPAKEEVYDLIKKACDEKDIYFNMYKYDIHNNYDDGDYDYDREYDEKEYANRDISACDKDCGYCGRCIDEVRWDD